MEVLNVINKIIFELNGSPLAIEDSLNRTGLEPYALVILFFKLNKLYPIFDISYVLDAIHTNIAVQSLINKVEQYEPRSNL